MIKCSLEQMLGPNNAMNWFRRGVADGATGERFLRGLRCTFIALSYTFLDQFHLAVIAGGATFNQWHICGQTHSIDMVAGRSVVQSVQHNLETLEETHAVRGASAKIKTIKINYYQLRFQAYLRSNAVTVCLDIDIWVESQCTLPGHLGF